MSEHKIAVYEDGGSPRIGLIAGAPDRKGRVEIVDPRGATRAMPAGKILLELPHRIGGTREAAGAALERLSSDAGALSPDLASLWELVREEGAPIPFDDLLELLYGNPSNREVLGLYTALWGDSIWFKRKGETWEAKSERLVAERLEQLNKQRRTEETRAAFLAHVGSALSGTDPLDRRTWESFLGQLREVALRGDEYQGNPFFPEAVRTLCKEHRIASTPIGFGAFGLLFRLGIFSLHEDLDLLRMAPPAVPMDLPPLPEPACETPAAFPLPLITVDDESTRDVDDALTVRTLEDGWELTVCIADPASVIQPGSPLDLAARTRATSIYRPDGTMHMLPEEISCDLLSLSEGVPRRGLLFTARIASDGALLEDRIEPATVCVDRRMSYQEVDTILSGSGTDSPGVLEAVRTLAAATDLLEARRRAAGGMDFPFPEARIRIVEDVPTITILDPTTPARRIVRECMILANTIAANYAIRNALPVIYQTQPPPDEPPGPTDTLARAWAVLRTLKKAEKSTIPSPHSSLGVPAYVQASSPLRRYADLLAHHQIKAHLAQEPPPFSPELLVEIMGHQEVVTAEAARLERARVRYWQLVWLEARVGEQFDAILLSDPDGRGHVTAYLPALALRCALTIGGRLAAGDVVQIQVIGVHPRRDELHLKHVV